MTILQFIWQITLICGVVIGLAVALFSAPWYVLGGILVVTFFITWRLMPTQEIYLSQFADTFNNELQQADSPSSHAGSISSSASQAPVHNSQPSDSVVGMDCSQPAVLSYRGLPYAVKAQSLDRSVVEKVESPPELKYRGAKVKLNPPQS